MSVIRPHVCAAVAAAVRMALLLLLPRLPLLTLLCWRGPAFLAYELLGGFSIGEVFRPIVIAGAEGLASTANILALACFTLPRRRGPAAFAHQLRSGAAIVEVLLPVVVAWLVEFASSAPVLMVTLPWRRGLADLAERKPCAGGILTGKVLRPKLATRFNDFAPAASVLLRLFLRFALLWGRRPTGFTQERAVAAEAQVVLGKLAQEVLQWQKLILLKRIFAMIFINKI